LFFALVDALLNEFLITIAVQYISFKKIILQTAVLQRLHFKTQIIFKNIFEEQSLKNRRK